MEYFSKDGVHLWILISSENTIGISGLKTAPDLKDSLHILRGGGGNKNKKTQEKKQRCKFCSAGAIINKTGATEKKVLVLRLVTFA